MTKNGKQYTFGLEGLAEGQTEATGQSGDASPDDPLFKVCRICEQTKPFTDFYETEGKLKRARCKECMRESTRTNGTGKKRGKKKGARASTTERHGTPASTTPEKLLAALSGAGSDTTLQAINGIIDTQKLIVELLRERR